MTKLVYSDWLISLALHGSLVAGVALLNQPSPPLATRPITEPIRWVDVQTMTSEPSASVHQKEIDTTDHLQKPKAQKQPLKAVYQTSDMDTLAKPMAQKTQKPKKNTATNQVKSQTKNQMTNQETSTKQAMITTPNASISSPIKTAIATVDKQSMDMSKNSVDEINIDTDTANVTTNAQEIEQPKKDENKTELQSKADKTTTDKTTIDETKADKTKTDETKDTQSAKNPKTDHVNQWKTRFIANVNRNKRYPSHARKAGIQGSALLSVHVMANGNIHCCDVKQSTGSSQLDKAALQAAQKAANQSHEPPQTNHAFGFDFYVDYILSD